MLWKWEWQTAKVRAEMAERRKRLMRQILAAMEEGVSKRLKAKEDEIASIGKLNWALEERIKGLCMENQIWRDLALSKEATANVLRTNLEQVLAAQVRVEEEGAATASDAESCCRGDNGEDGAEEGTKAGGWRIACRSCREREPSVLLLPCRHLCLCLECGPAVDACPIDQVKTQSIRSYLGGTSRRHRKFSFMSPSLLPLIGDTRLAAIVDRLCCNLLPRSSAPCSPTSTFLLTTWKFPGYGVLIDDKFSTTLRGFSRWKPKAMCFVIGIRASISSSGGFPSR
ncbi:hypothetical protein BHE74_00055050 [Ensete ventricosum]|nr:hypothetical protein BHE74_00055050 [Ensete ventricosum]